MTRRRCSRSGGLGARRSRLARNCGCRWRQGLAARARQRLSDSGFRIPPPLRSGLTRLTGHRQCRRRQGLAARARQRLSDRSPGSRGGLQRGLRNVLSGRVSPGLRMPGHGRCRAGSRLHLPRPHRCSTRSARTLDERRPLGDGWRQRRADRCGCGRCWPLRWTAMPGHLTSRRAWPLHQGSCRLLDDRRRHRPSTWCGDAHGVGRLVNDDRVVNVGEDDVVWRRRRHVDGRSHPNWNGPVDRHGQNEEADRRGRRR